MEVLLQEERRMINWESIIAERNAMHGTVMTLRIEDARKRNKRMYEKRWRKNNPEKVKEIQKRSEEKRKNDPNRKAWQKAYDQSPQRKRYHKQYREDNRDEINARHRVWNASPEGKQKNAEYNAMWREKNKEYDRKRKQEWWRSTHPNPKPRGRPKKEIA